LWTDLLDVDGVTTKVNYGLDKVRFPAPVSAGSRLRLGGRLGEVAEIEVDGLQFTADVVVEIENGTKPACVARPVFRFYA
jgi:acyl dehydratase